MTPQQKKHCERIAAGLIRGNQGARNKYHQLENAGCHEAVAYIKACCRRMGNTSDSIFAGIPQVAKTTVNVALTPVRFVANTAGRGVHWVGSLLQGLAHKL